MPTKHHSSRQLHLFQPRPRIPQWNQLSRETRQQVLPLLAKLLQTTLPHCKKPSSNQGVSHER